MRNFKLSVATFAALMVSATTMAQTQAEVQAKFNEAAAKFNAKDYAAAIPLFEETIKMTDTSPDDVLTQLEDSQKYITNCYMNYGMALARGGKFDEALVNFEKAKDVAYLSGNSITETKAAAMIGNVYYAQGSAALKAGDPVKAGEFFSEGYNKDKKNTKLGLSAAQCYAKGGEMEKATEIYKELIALGEVHSKYKPAAEDAKAAFASGLLVAASEGVKNNDYAVVTSNIETILSVDPTNAQALLMRVQAANNMKKTADVIKYGDEAAAAQTDPAVQSNVYFILGTAYQVQENKAKAIESYKKVTAGANVAAAKEMITALSQQ